jgi:hypothetical protein
MHGLKSINILQERVVLRKYPGGGILSPQEIPAVLLTHDSKIVLFSSVWVYLRAQFFNFPPRQTFACSRRLE